MNAASPPAKYIDPQQRPSRVHQSVQREKVDKPSKDEKLAATRTTRVISQDAKTLFRLVEETGVFR